MQYPSEVYFYTLKTINFKHFKAKPTNIWFMKILYNGLIFDGGHSLSVFVDQPDLGLFTKRLLRMGLIGKIYNS